MAGLVQLFSLLILASKENTMYKWLLPVISTAAMALPLASFAANDNPAAPKPKPTAKKLTKGDAMPGASTMVGKSDDGDKPKPEKPPKKDAMVSKVGMTSAAGMVGKSDEGDKPKPEKPPKKEAIQAGATMSR